MLAALARLAPRGPRGVVPRRSLFATPPFNAKAARTASPKPQAKRGENKPKEPTQRVRIPKDLRPPKRAPGPYFIFYASFVRSQPKAASLQEVQELSKRAGEIWRGYSMAEKQPFYDENEGRKAQAKQEREEFFSKTSPAALKQLNAIRTAQGKTKFHSTKKTPLPVRPFILFSNEFRSSPDSQALINETAPEKSYTVRAAIAAADRWKTMSDLEKAPYYERFQKAKEELKAEQSDS